MHVALNAFFLQLPNTGSGEHLYGLLEALDGVDESDSFQLLYPRLTESRVLRTPHLGPQFRLTEAGGIASRLGVRLGKLWWEQVTLRELCVGGKVDLLHSPYFASPLFPNLPTVVTIHDVIPLILPRYGNAPHVRLYMALVSAAARRADAVLTVSEASKRDIVGSLGIPPDRIHVTYNAAEPRLQPVMAGSMLESTREAHGISSDFLLYFGGFDLRKNVERVVRAFKAARPNFDRPCQLVLAGSLSLVGHPLYPDPRSIISELGLERDVVVTGRITEEEKPLLYSAATAFVFPSLYEGFGIPVLEAMACGAPVITSNISSLPEVAGDAALFVDPTSLGDMAGAMVRLFNDRPLREELRGRGLRRAREFSWEATARKTLAVYRQVLS